MLNRFGGGDECKCIVRLLDDTEVIECQVQVSLSFALFHYSIEAFPFPSKL